MQREGMLPLRGCSQNWKCGCGISWNTNLPFLLQFLTSFSTEGGAPTPAPTSSLETWLGAPPASTKQGPQLSGILHPRPERRLTPGRPQQELCKFQSTANLS